MSRGFGTTYGVGSTDIVTTGYTGYANARSYWAWVWPDSATAIQTANSRIFYQGPSPLTAGVYSSFDGVSVNNVDFTAFFDGTQGQWNTDGGNGLVNNDWGTIGWRYDASSTANDPVLFKNGDKFTVGGANNLNEVGTPTGNHVSASGLPFMIGNRGDGLRNWGGFLAHEAVWNCLLNDQEFQALYAGALPSSIRPQSLAAYWPLDGYLHPIWDRGPLRRFAGSLTGTKFQGPSPPLLSAAPTWLTIKDEPGIFSPPTITPPMMIFSAQTLQIPLSVNVSVTVS